MIKHLRNVLNDIVKIMKKTFKKNWSSNVKWKKNIKTKQKSVQLNIEQKICWSSLTNQRGKKKTSLDASALWAGPSQWVR